MRYSPNRQYDDGTCQSAYDNVPNQQKQQYQQSYDPACQPPPPCSATLKPELTEHGRIYLAQQGESAASNIRYIVITDQYSDNDAEAEQILCNGNPIEINPPVVGENTTTIQALIKKSEQGEATTPIRMIGLFLECDSPGGKTLPLFAYVRSECPIATVNTYTDIMLYFNLLITGPSDEIIVGGDEEIDICIDEKPGVNTPYPMRPALGGLYEKVIFDPQCLCDATVQSIKDGQVLMACGVTSAGKVKMTLARNQGATPAGANYFYGIYRGNCPPRNGFEILVQTGGVGQVWVSSSTGSRRENIQAGDILGVSSECGMNGYADPFDFRSAKIGRALESVDWEEIQPDPDDTEGTFQYKDSYSAQQLAKRKKILVAFNGLPLD